MLTRARKTERSAAAEAANGTVRDIDGQDRVYYDGYWIRHYQVPNTLAYKQRLIDSLTRRVFHHAEPGINTPGNRLEIVRTAYDNEADPVRKRVLAAMLAGALLNRGADILTRIVELEQIGIEINAENELLKECGRCFMGALEHGKHIRPVTGKEGLDELWGEPFKAFTMDVGDFLQTRYLKVAMAMRAIDAVSDRLTETFGAIPMFKPITPLIRELACSARLSSETMRADMENIDVWPRFVAAADRLHDAAPVVPDGADRRQHTLARRGRELIQQGGKLMIDLANLRVPMPRTTEAFLSRLDSFEKRFMRRDNT